MPPFASYPPDLAEHLRAALAAPMPRGREPLAYRTKPEHLNRAVVDGKAHVVFVAYYPLPGTVKKSIALRASGRYYTTFLACCVREDTACERFFDQVYEPADYAELLDLLSGAAPAAVNAHIQPSFLGAVVLEAVDPARVVVEVNDSQLFMKRDPQALECRLEAEVLRRAGALTHKMPPEALEEIRRDYGGLAAPDVLVHALPCREFFMHAEPAPPPPHRMVYAGGVMPRHIALAAGHENQLFDDLILATTGGDIELTFLVNRNARDMHWEEHQGYFELERSCPHFTFRLGLPFFELPRELARHHWGLLYDNVALSSYRLKAFAYNMSTKIFSYFEAGLPIVVFEEFTYIRRFVERHGLGLVYSLDRLEELPALLAQADYPTLRRNVLAFRESHELSGNLAALEALYARS